MLCVPPSDPCNIQYYVYLRLPPSVTKCYVCPIYPFTTKCYVLPSAPASLCAKCTPTCPGISRCYAPPEYIAVATIEADEAITSSDFLKIMGISPKRSQPG